MSSASRPSEAVVNPTRSANRTETSRRSAAGADAAAASRAAAAARAREPHSPQNFVVGAFAVPHAEQATRERAAALAAELPARPRSPRCRRGRRCVVTGAVSHVGQAGRNRGALRSPREREAAEAGRGRRRRGAQRLRRGAGARSALVAARAAHPDAPDRGLRRAPGRRRGRRRCPLGADPRDRDRRRDGGDPPHARVGAP